VNINEIRQNFLTPADELTALDYELSASDESYEEARLAESGLIDDYVTGRLSGRDREAFETNYLVSNARRESVADARLLAEAAARAARPAAAPAHATRWLYPSLAFGLVALLAILGLQLSRPAAETPSLGDRTTPEAEEPARPVQVGNAVFEPEAVQPAENAEPPRRRIAVKTPAVARGVVATISLSPRSYRNENGAEATVAVDRRRTRVRLDLELEPAVLVLGDFTAEVRDTEGKPVYASTAAAPDGSAERIVVSIPPGRLRPGTYILFLSGREPGKDKEPAGEYVFRVVKR
jgi:hypothetical protein